MPKHHAYLDALRGYAILGVVLTHSRYLIGDRPSVMETYASFGRFGVELFFVVSAFTLTKSWLDRRDGAAPFFIRRLFRIAPAFWLAILAYLLFPWWPRDYWAPHGVDVSAVLQTALFVHGWTPETINAVVGGDWSIAAECGFYALFPLLMLLKGWRSAAVAAVLAAGAAWLSAVPVLAMLHALFPQTPAYLIGQFQVLWLPGVLYIFLGGIACAHASRKLRVGRQIAEAEVIAALIALAVMPFAPTISAIPAIGPALAFLVLVHGMSQGAGRWLVNPAVARIGTVSFSIYLCQFAVITAMRQFTLSWPSYHGFGFVILYIGALGISYGLAEVSYRLIERPMVGLGSKLARRSRGSRAPVQLAAPTFRAV